MILDIFKEPEKILREVAKPVSTEEFNSPELLKLVRDMTETMFDANGVGLAAPQVGVGKRVIVVAPPNAEPMAVLNPEIVKRSILSNDSEEGCLSVPGVWGFVRRANAVTVKGMTPEGAPFKMNLKDFPATIFQHEIDHLNGVLFIDKAKNVTKLGVSKGL